MRKLVPLLLVTGLVAGCGNDSTFSSTAPFSPGSDSAIQPLGESLVGRVLLDAPLRGASVRFFTLDGAAIPTTAPVVTDGAGFFEAFFLSPPTSFRAVAQKDGESYASDFRNFSPAQHVIITPLTNLWSARQRAHPEETPEQAAASLRAGLGLPADFDLLTDMGTVGHRPGFVAVSYIREARGSGNNASSDGVSPFVAATLARLASNQTGAQNRIFSDPQSNAWASQGVQLGVSVVTALLMANGAPVGGIIGWGVGILLQPLTGNPSASQFQAVAAELEALGQQIEEMYLEIKQVLAETQYIEDFNRLKERTAGLIQASGQKLLDAYLNGLSSVQRDALAAELSSVDLLTALLEIHNSQTGLSPTNGLLGQANQLVKLSSLKYYSNATVFNPLATEFHYFAGLQTQAITLLIEGFHGQEPPDTLSARTNYDVYCANLAQQATYLPQPLPSDEVIYLTQEGLIFYRRVIGPSNSKTAQKHAAGVSEGPFKKFHVASSSEVRAAMDAAPSKTQAGLEAMGFDFSGQVGSNANLAVAVSDGDGVDLQTGLNVTLSNWSLSSHHYLLVADLTREQVQADPSDFVALGRLKGLRVQEDRANSCVRAFGNYTVNLKKESVPLNDVEISSLVRWSTSDSSTLRIQNLPAGSNAQRLPNTPTELTFGPGHYTWLTPGSPQATVNASAQDPYDSSLRTVASANVTLTGDNVAIPTVRTIRIGPRERILNVLGAPGAQPLNFRGYRSDGTEVDLAGQGTITASIPEVQIRNSSTNPQLQIDTRPSVSQFTVTANYNGLQDQVTFYVNFP